jgi:hypothetical protein
MHASDLLIATEAFDVPIKSMFDRSSVVEFEEDDDERLETTADMHHSIGFITCASMMTGKSPPKLIRQYGTPFDPEDYPEDEADDEDDGPGAKIIRLSDRRRK